MKICSARFRIFIALVIFFLWESNVQACPKTHCVRVGAWNVEWLGSDKRSQPVDDKTIESIANLISEELSIDIITLQEINTEMQGEVRGEKYSLLPWKKLQQSLQKRGYQSYSGESGYAQHIVLAWRTSITVLQKPTDLNIPDSYELHPYCHSSRLRKPLGGLFRSEKFDFWFIGLHLKSSGDSSACSADIRVAQTIALVSALIPLEKKDPDIIIAGDFNASGRNKTLSKLFDAGFDVMDDKARRNPASNTHSYHSETSKNKNSGSLIDHIMIRPEFTEEWQFQSTTIYKPKDAAIFASTFSDHLPIWADFSTHRDDD